MNGLQIYLLGCLIAYPISIYFLKTTLNESKDLNLFELIQKELEIIKPSINPNFTKNLFIGGYVILSWAVVLFWIYLKIGLFYFIIKNNLKTKN